MSLRKGRSCQASRSTPCSPPFLQVGLNYNRRFYFVNLGAFFVILEVVRNRTKMKDLASMKCVPCQGGVPPLKGEELQSFYQDLNNGWEVGEEHHRNKPFAFSDFKSAL